MARRKSERTQKSEVEGFRSLFEQSLDAVYVGAPDGSVIDVNQPWLDLFGYTVADLPSLNAIDFYADPADLAGFLRRITDKGVVKDEVLYKRKNGSRFLCQRSMVAHKDASGNIIAIQGVYRDVSLLRTSEDARRASELRLRSLFEQSIDAIYVTAPDGSSLEVNQAWLDLFGYSRDDVQTVNAIDVYADPADRARFLQRIGRDGFVRDEVRFRRKDGSVVDAERTVVTVKDDSGRVIAYQGIIRDVTARKKADEALRRSEAYNRSIVEVIPDLIIRVNTRGELLDIVASSDEALAVPRDEIPGKTMADILSREDALRAQEAVAEALETGSVQTMEYQLEMPAGKRWFEARFSPAERDEVVALIRDITDRKHAEDALRESEARFRSLFEQSMDAINIATADGSIIEANPAWLELFGYSHDELPSLSAASLYADPTQRTSLRERIAGSGFVKDEVRLKRKDQTVFDCERTVVALRDDTGTIVAYQGVHHDITARKQAALAVAASEAKYRDLFEHSMDAISLVSPGGRFIEVNQAYLDLFGYSKADIEKLNIEDQYVNPEDRTRLLERLSTSETLRDDAVLLKKRDGTVMECVRTVVVRRDEVGHVIGEQSVIRDVTTARRAERALRASEQEFRTLFEQSMDAIYIVNYDGSHMRVNPSWLKLFGYTSEEVSTLNVIDLYANPDDRKDLLAAIARTDNVADEVRFKKKDGTEFVCARTVTARRDEKGNIIAFQGIMRDVTQQMIDHAELEHLAQFDALTGLLNRRIVLEKLDEWIEHVRRYRGHLSVAMLDIDHFKRVNDRHGHQAGDRVLTDIAHMVQQKVRTTDFAGRYGGEEFLLVLPRTDVFGAASLAERIRAALEAMTEHTSEGKVFKVTVSMGVAELVDRENTDSFVGRADEALYRAKAAGRNRVESATLPGDDA